MSDLEISSSFVGAALRPCTIDVPVRRCMNFAAGILDQSPCYLDDRQPQGVVAHPMLVCALTWQISSRLQDHLMADGFPFQVSKQQVHYSERITWQRPVRPADRLTIRGQIAAILPHRSGTHLVVRYEASDPEGQWVFTEHTGALLRGVRCADEGRCIELYSPVVGHNYSATLWEQDIDLHPLAAHIYDGCAEISFPIHSSPAFARSVGLPGIIMQGTATAAMAVSELIRRESNGDPGRVTEIECHFVGMISPGTAFKVRLQERQESDAFTELYWNAQNAQGRLVMSDGRMKIEKG